MQRLRRTRKNAILRELVSETQIKKSGLIYPVFVRYGKEIREEIPSMPDVYRYSVDMLDEVAEQVAQAGIGGVMLFGIPQEKDETGSGARDENGMVAQAIRKFRSFLKRRARGF